MSAGRPKGTGRHSNAAVIKALGEGGSDSAAAQILNYKSGRTVTARRTAMGLKWVAVPPELVDAVVEMAVERQAEIDAAGSSQD